MCLAIYKPAETSADWYAYRNGFEANDDSWGFAAVVDGSIVTRCGIGDFNEFREAFEPYADRQAIIHFRWATHGKTDTDNCHPFMVSDTLAVIHNGIISIKCEVNTDRSDTWHFNELVLKPMHTRDPDFFLRNDVMYSQQLAHTGSKFVFLRADGDCEIWNEEAGAWASDGHWYSNDSHEGRTSRYIGYGVASRTTTASASSRAWTETAEGRWRYTDDSVTSSSQYDEEKEEQEEYDEEKEEAFFTDRRMDDLRSYGVSRQCLKEVLEYFGASGIEALHDLI
jgi:predicted glutamine amidotransferase